MSTPLRTTPLESVLLRSDRSSALVAPERGGMVTRWQVDGEPVLFLDEASLLDRTKNVRGGSPVLFPSPGRLAGDRYARDGHEGAMGQHGFARNAAWDVVHAATDEVTLRLGANDASRAVFPWDFVATLRYSLLGPTLRIEQRFESRGAAPMPFGAGFHPYFHVPDASKARARVPTRATRAWDNARRAEVTLTSPIDLTEAEVDLHLLDHGSSVASVERGDGRRIEIRASAEYRRWVVWTLAGRDFVCLEPWTCPANALNTGQDLLVAEAGAPVELFVEMALV